MISDNRHISYQSIKFQDYVYKDDTKPFTSLPGGVEGIIVSTQLKPKYAAWAQCQPILGVRKYSTMRELRPASRAVSTFSTTASKALVVLKVVQVLAKSLK